MYVFFQYFLGFFWGLRGRRQNRARDFIRMRFLLSGWFMDYEGQSDRDSERERGEERDNDVDTKSVKFILQYALYVRAINNKERVDNNAQIERGGKEKDREREG